MWNEVKNLCVLGGAVAGVLAYNETKQRQEEIINKAVDRHFENEKTKNEESK